MWTVCLYIVISTFLYFGSENSAELISDEDKAWKFLYDSDQVYTNSCLYGKYSDLGMTTSDFAWQNFSDHLLKRAFNATAETEAIAEVFDQISQLKEGKRVRELGAEMKQIFFGSTICSYTGHQIDIKGNCEMLNRSEVLQASYNTLSSDERKYYWVEQHNTVGRMRNAYIERQQLRKELNIYPKYKYLWFFGPEQSAESMAQDLENMWEKIFPLYKQIHAYVRRHLINVYGDSIVTGNGPIPAHLFGPLTEHWWGIIDITLPYPEKDSNVTEILKKRNTTVRDMFNLSEDFFVSLGLPSLDESFWSNSHFQPNIHCSPRFNFSCEGKVTGLSACTPINEFYLRTIIGSFIFVHVYNQKFLREPRWPNILTKLESPSFQIALRYAVELSTWTNDYLSKVGITETIPKTKGQVTADDINHLMKVVLRYFVRISEMYKIEKWELDTVTFKTSDKDYNKMWWKNSLKYQGICPPVRRTENDFDPAISKTVAQNVPPAEEIIAIAYTFQFYKAACKEAGHTDLLHRCNLYGVKTFGDRIRKVINLGLSITWQERLSIMTNGESVTMDPTPLLEYMQPLYEWLRKENEHETIGWESSDPMSCP